MTTQKIRQQILDEMNARRIDRKTYIDSEWLLSEYEKTLHTSLVAAVEGKKKQPTEHGIPCPDGRVGCLVYHFETRLSKEDAIYNQALDDTLTIINSIFKE